MIVEFLSLFCLGLCLGHEDEKKNEKLPKPSLIALPSSMVERSSNVTLKCQSRIQNVTFILEKLQDSGYKREQRSAGHHVEFLLTDLKLKDAGTYFCSYKTMASHECSEKSEHLQLMVTDYHDGRVAPSIKTGSSNEEPTKRTSHPKFSEQEATDADLSKMERISILTEEPQEVTCAELNTKVPSEAASVPAEEPAGSCECATPKA
uniref:V-set and transmembrane domain containing 1 n=1 Tax=Equus caballus TaxID=9796 RepID=A0A5F5PYZ6_HORSE